MKKDYRCTEYDIFPSHKGIEERKKALLNEVSLEDDDNHYSYVSKRKSKANKLFRDCYYNKCVYCGVPEEINSRRLFEVDHYICKTTIKENIKINHIRNLVNACYECNRKKTGVEIPKVYLNLLNPDINIDKVFFRDSNFKIQIKPVLAKNKNITSFYNKLCLSGELRRLDYLLMNLIGLQKKIKSQEIIDKLAHCIQLLMEKRNQYIE